MLADSRSQRDSVDGGVSSPSSARVLSYGAAILTVGMVSLLTAALWPVLEPSPSLFFFPAVMAVALYFGLGPGLLATVLSTVSLAFFFLPPYFSLKVGLADFARLAVFVVTTITITSLAGARRRADDSLRRLTHELEQRVAERTAELAAAQRALDTAQRLEAIGQLAGGIAHDFNNLLTVIIGNAELLAHHLPPDSDSHALLTEVRKAAARAASLTRQLLAYSRRQRLQPQLVSLNAVVQDVMPMLQRLLPNTVTIAVNLAEGLPQVRADPAQLQQVIMNLAVNATDAMPNGGTFTLATMLVHLASNDLQDHRELASGAYIRLTATDTGNGMDADTARRAFEPFYTTKPVGKGTGLGLSTAYGIVAQSGGVIRLETASGMGATFSIYLPVVRPAWPDDPPASM